MDNLPYDRKLYFQRENGSCAIGMFIDCGEYVRFMFNGISKDFDSWSSQAR